MNQMRVIFGTALSVLLFFGLFLWTSCDKSKTKYNATTTIRPCDNVICLNGATCKDGLCYCPQGFEGDKCQIKWSDKFVGAFQAKDACYTGSDVYYNVQISANPDYAYKVKLFNLGVFCPLSTLDANITSEKTNLQIPLQKGCGNLYLSGTGSISGNFINVYLIARDTMAHTSQQCSIQLSRQ